MNRKQIGILLLIILLGAIQSCRNESASIKRILYSKGDLITIKVEEPYDNNLKFDSIFQDIKIITLETRNACMISEITKIRIQDGLIYLHEFFANNLFVFDTAGKFIRKIGIQGRGPGEYHECRDFDVDIYGNIYILDYLRIIMYDKYGKTIREFSFKSAPEDPFYANPLQFAFCGVKGFYLWGGTFGLSTVKNLDKHFGMYLIDKKGKKLEGFFPITYKFGETPNRFSKFKSQYNLIPPRANDTIYRIDTTGIFPKYFVDFGSQRVPQKLLKGDSKSRSNIVEDLQKYSYQVDPFIETDNWIFFRFIFENYFYKVYYSKTNNKSYVSKSVPKTQNEIMPHSMIGTYENDMVSIMEPNRILGLIKKMQNIDDTKISKQQQLLLDKLKRIKETDNPILFICKMK